MTSGVYLLEFPEIGEHIYKIGYSKNIEGRITDIERYYGKSIITFIFPVYGDGLSMAEEVLHRIFWKKRYRDVWYGRELFSLSKDDIKLYHKACKMIERKMKKGIAWKALDGLPNKGAQNEGEEIHLPRSLGG